VDARPEHQRDPLDVRLEAAGEPAVFLAGRGRLVGHQIELRLDLHEGVRHGAEVIVVLARAGAARHLAGIDK
jgi:hypothetical protein